MKTTIEQLKPEIAALKNAIQKGWATGQEAKLTEMEAELDRLLAADKPSAELPPKEEEQTINEQLETVMQAKENVRSQLLPKFVDQKISDFQLVASVAECFAENRVHTLAYEVPTALREQFNNSNAYLSFKSIKTTELSSREIKKEQAKKNWATVCTNYTTQSTGKFRNTDADKTLKVGSQIVTYSEAIKYQHNPDNLLGYVKVEFEQESLQNLKTEVDESLDLDIDEARMQQKRWYVKNKETILDSLDSMETHKPAQISKEKFERYKLLLAIAHIWGEDHFNHVLNTVHSLILATGKNENEKFAEALKQSIQSIQANFTTTLCELPSDTLIEYLKKHDFSCSRQTLPTALKAIGVNTDSERKQITFFGNTVQGYSLEILQNALKPFKDAA